MNDLVRTSLAILALLLTITFMVTAARVALDRIEQVKTRPSCSLDSHEGGTTDDTGSATGNRPDLKS